MRRITAGRCGRLHAAAFAHAARRRPPDRHQMLLPVTPVRWAMLWLAGMLTAVAQPTWVVGSPPVAMISAWPTCQPGRRRREVRNAAAAVGLVIVGGSLWAILLALVELLPSWATAALRAGAYAALGMAAVAIAWSRLRMAVHRRAEAPLRAARLQVLKALGPPVWEVGALVSLDAGAGTVLAEYLCDMADEAGWVLLAQADHPARARLYRRFGFAPAAAVTLPWGLSYMLVRRPTESVASSGYIEPRMLENPSTGLSGQ